MGGLTYPIPFATPQQVIEIARRCEAMGYHSVWGNDHMTTQRYVRDEFATPPNYWETLVTYAFVATAKTKLRFGTSMLVLPMRRDIVMTAKQIATLDQISGGRLEIGIGIGAYREEFEALHPQWKARRGEMVEEGIQALRKLFTERNASFDGKYYQYRDVEMYPKPKQKVLPLLIGGNSAQGIRRAALHADGWIPACVHTDFFAAGVKRLRYIAAENGRDLRDFEIAPQFAVYVAKTHEEAVNKFPQSQMFKHLGSLNKSTLKDQGNMTHIETNIIGSVDECIEKSQRHKEAGATHLLGLYFAVNTVEELVDQAQVFAEEIVPRVS